MATSVGDIAYDARINTSALKGDAYKADAIARTTGESIGSSIEKGEGRASKAFGTLVRTAKWAGAAVGVAIAIGIVKNVDNAVKRVDTLQAFPRVLQAMGISATDSKAAMDKLDKSIRGLPTSLQEGAKGVQQFVAAGLGADKATDAYLAMNNALLAAGGGAEETQIVMQSLTRALSGGKTAASTIQAALSRMPTALKALQEQTGKSAGELFKLYAANPQKLMNDLIKLNTEGGGGLASLSNQAREATKGIGTAFDNMNTAITRGLAKIMTAIGTGNIANVITNIGKTFEASTGFVIRMGTEAVALGTKVATYLAPKLQALWNTLTGQLIPAISIFYNNYIKPLIPVIGVALVGALGLAIDVLNIFTKIVSGIVGWFGQYRMATAVLAGVITTLLLPALTVWIIKLIAMKVQAGITAIANVLAATTSGVAWAVAGAKTWAAWALTFARMIARGAVAAAQAVAQAARAGAAWVLSSGKASKAVSALHTLVGKKIPMGPIVVVAALAAIALVMKAVQEVIGAINAMNDAHASIDANSKIEEGSTKQLQNLVKNGTPAQQKRAKASLGGIAGNRAVGGPVLAKRTYLVGERGPELFTPKFAGEITSNDNLNKPGNIVNITVHMDGILARSRADIRDIGKDIIRAVNEELTAKQLAPIGGGSL